METETWQESAARVVEKFGYIVMGSCIPKLVGEILPVGRVAHYGRPTGQPWRIVAEATEAEYIRQCEFVGWSYAIPRVAHYYRIETD